MFKRYLTFGNENETFDRHWRTDLSTRMRERYYSFTNETWLIYKWDMTHSDMRHDHSDMRHDSFLDMRVEDSNSYSGHVLDESCLTRVRESCVRHKWMRHDSLRYETWLIQIWGMTRSHMGHDSFTYICKLYVKHKWMRHDSFRYETWLIQIWDMTHSTNESRLIHTTHSHHSYLNESCLIRESLSESHVSRAYISTRDMTPHTYKWVMVLVPTWDMTPPHMRTSHVTHAYISRWDMTLDSCHPRIHI